MADLKKEIEDRLILSKDVLQLFNSTRLLNDRERKHVSTRSTRIRSRTEYDVHEHTVTLVQDTPIEKHIHPKAIRKGVLAMQGERLRKVIYNGTTYSQRGNLYVAEISFIMIHSFEKTGIRLFSRR